MRKFRVGEVAQGASPQLPSSLAGARIDFPEPDSVHAGCELEVAGWDVGAEIAVEKVRLVDGEGRVLAVADMEARCADVVELFPDAAQGRYAAFRLRLSMRALGEWRLRVEGILATGRMRRFGELRVVSRTPAGARSRALVLMYHRVMAAAADSFGLSLPATSRNWWRC